MTGAGTGDTDASEDHDKPRRLAGGVLVLAMLVLSIAAGFSGAVPSWLPAMLAWMAALTLFPDTSGLPRAQALVLAFAGIGALAAAAHLGAGVPVLRALSVNQNIITLLAAVSFIRIVGDLFREHDEQLPVGKPAIARTLLGTALTGAAINVSALIIVGDRIAPGARLSRLQAIVLSRAFASTALWSPLFISMATALTYSPGASLTSLLAVGLPLGLVSLAYTLRELGSDPEAASFRGYPAHRSALVLPATLAGAVIVWHQLAPELPVLTLVSTLALALSFGLGLWHYRATLPARVHRHVRRDLGGMSGELLLFLSAGLFATGTLTLVTALSFALPFERFGAQEAALVVTSTTLAGAIGLHPIISVSVWSGLLHALQPAPSPDLMALSFLMGWALGVSISPLSGLHLFIQGRFGTPAHCFPRWNTRYTIAMLLVCVATLYTVEAVLRGPGGT